MSKVNGENKMNDNIAKSICTVGIWFAVAAIEIWAQLKTPAPVEILVLFVAGFSTAAIWNYKASNFFRSRVESENTTIDVSRSNQ